ncbi:MAG: hypothetical protein Q4B26_05790 [Eubacteriales bacterium]|nr:hypothetical protein [Eubacteriales bacterium]
MMIRAKKVVALVCLASMCVSGCSAKTDDSKVVPTESTEAGTEHYSVEETEDGVIDTSINDNKEEAEGFSLKKEDEKPNEIAAENAENEKTAEISTEIEEEKEEDDGLTDIQRNSINMLNYMTVLTQQINESSRNQLFLESAYSSLVNNVYPNSVDSNTQSQITSLLDAIENYRMIPEKRSRIEYIYEQKKAQALWQAIPNPRGLSNAVSSKDELKIAEAVICMGIESVSKYSEASSQADLEFVEGGWELDDEEAEGLHESTKSQLSYMFDIVRSNSLPGDLVLNQTSVQDLVAWSNKTNLVSVISWLEENESTYKEFGPYWLELAEDYYQSEDYESCLSAIASYESVTTRIFRKDYDYAKALPMAIISAKETLSEKDYIKTASNYCNIIKANTDDTDWSLRYFAAQINLDMYSLTKDASYLDEAYDIAYNNVNVLVDEQKALNTAYLADIEKAKADKGATKREKKEVKDYNNAIEAERKTALPPVSEALYLNCDLLFALADEKGISNEEQSKIDAILHENEEPIFLTTALDNKFWFSNINKPLGEENISVEFNGVSLKLPVTVVTDRSKITVEISNSEGTTVISDWEIEKVDRPKKSAYIDYTAEYSSTQAKDYKYQDGDSVKIFIIPVVESPEETLSFEFTAEAGKRFVVLDDVTFERNQ